MEPQKNLYQVVKIAVDQTLGLYNLSSPFGYSGGISMPVSVLETKTSDEGSG